MATQTIEFRSPPSQTITAKLFAVGSDTQVDSVSTTEATNRKGTYAAAYTDVPAGEYELIALVSTTPVARWFVTLTLTTATFQVYDKSQTVLMVANVVNASALAADAVAEIQSGLATAATALSTAQWTNTLATNIGTTNTTVASNLDTTVSGRMATYTQPTGFLAATFPATVASTTNITSASGITVSSIGANVITASALAADAVAEIADGIWDEATSGHTTAGTYGGRIVRATNSNVEVQITGSNHVAADVHAFQTDVIDSAAIAASAVAEIQSGLATSANLLIVSDGVGFLTSVMLGTISDAGTAGETYVITFGGATYTSDFAGLDSTGNRTGVTRTKV